jgi:DNA-binding transcriptional regulator YdaS (Cro superfamily)
MRPPKYPYTPNPGILEAIEKAGGQTKLASLVGLRQCTISQFLRRRVAPKNFAQKVSELFNIPMEMLRPEITSVE